ncbi:MAG: DUF2145 domain-containing protein [Mariprofundales bacterium]
MINKSSYVVVLCCCFLFLAPIAQAGSSSGGELLHPVKEVLTFAKQVERTMAAHGAYVAILARVGSPPKSLPDGIQFTHVAFAVYADITTQNGRHLRGYTIYNLYQDADNKAHSSLVQDYPPDFFASTPVLKAGIIIPTAKLQARLLPIITGDIAQELHNPNYSVIANPNNNQFQNCTEFTLRQLVAAIYHTQYSAQVQANINTYFEPQEVKVNGLKLLLGSLFSSDISLADQDNKHKPHTSTFGSIAKFMNKYDLITAAITIEAGEEEQPFVFQ